MVWLQAFNGKFSWEMAAMKWSATDFGSMPSKWRKTLTLTAQRMPTLSFCIWEIFNFQLTQEGFTKDECYKWDVSHSSGMGITQLRLCHYTCWIYLPLVEFKCWLADVTFFSALTLLIAFQLSNHFWTMFFFFFFFFPGTFLVWSEGSGVWTNIMVVQWLLRTRGGRTQINIAWHPTRRECLVHTDALPVN